MEPRSRWESTLKRVLGPALLALMVTTVLAVGVSAHDGSGGPGGGGPGGGGGGGATISAINGTQLTLVTADGWTRTLDASGVTVMSGTSAITLGDLKVGDEIAIRQSRNFDGTVQVVEIDLVPPHVDGTVTAVNASTLTIQTAAGATKTVTVTATTAYGANRASATLADVTVGSVARVQGTANADGTFTATSVSVHPANLGGTVTATTADSITVADASGATATIHVSATTTYRTATGAGALADAVVGSIVRAEGVRNADGSLNATAVRIGTADAGFGGNRGGGHRGFGGPDGATPASPSANPSANPSASPSA